MEKTENPASLDSAAEEQFQPLSETEVRDVSGGAGNGKTNIIIKVSGVPGAPPGLGTSRQPYFK
ncbi:MAG: hypothetical protein ACN6PR_03290 [Achromobacter sp.]